METVHNESNVRVIRLSIRMPHSAIVTNCTSKKRFVPDPRQMARTMERSDVRGLSRDWCTRRMGAGAVAVRDLYQGRSFKMAERSAEQAGAKLFAISAGYGLIAADDLIPPYSVTVSGDSEDNILTMAGGAKASAWWEVLEPLTSTIGDLATLDLVMFALSAEYLLMVEADLERLKRSMHGTLLIFACAGAAQRLRSDLAAHVMPYGNSLESGGSPVRGTGADAAQRRLLHFTTYLAPALGAEFSLSEARQAVEGFAQTLLVPLRQPGRAVSDSEVLELISRLRSDGVTSRTAALRHLRSVRGMACSQARFQALFQSVQ